MKNQFIILMTGILFIVSCGKTEDTGFVCGDTITDIDGNVYHTVSIGSQCWTVENLKTTKYNDGSSIPNITDKAQWAEDSTFGAYSLYNNADSNNVIFGKLYNWYAVRTGKLAPTGWHVPSDLEWTALYNNLGGDSIAGGQMKDTSSLWFSPNVGATNSSGFKALPAGYRYASGDYYIIREVAFFWSTTQIDTLASGYSWTCELNNTFKKAYRRVGSKGDGVSIRCIKD